MKHKQNALDAIRSRGGQVVQAWGTILFTLGGRQFQLEDRDGPSVSEFSDSIHRLVGFAPQRTASDAKREQVADAALWLWLNRDMARRGAEALGATDSAMIIRMFVICQDYDARQAAEAATINLDATAWGQIKEAASQSPWMPPEYMMNEWVADVCAFLRNPPESPWRTDTPPYDVMLLVEFADSYGNLKKVTACYVEQAIFSITPHGSWYSTQTGDLVKLRTIKRWMEIPQ